MGLPRLILKMISANQKVGFIAAKALSFNDSELIQGFRRDFNQRKFFDRYVVDIRTSLRWFADKFTHKAQHRDEVLTE